MSHNALEYWFFSSGTVNQIVSVDTIDWAGWDLKVIPFNKIGGSDGRSFHSVVIKQTVEGEKSGTIYFDEGQIILPTSVDDHLITNEINFISYPNPFSSTGTVSFTLNEKAVVKLEIYTLSGQRIGHLFSGELERGSHIFTWTPAVSVGSGIYIYRLELQKRINGFPVIITKNVF